MNGIKSGLLKSKKLYRAPISSIGKIDDNLMGQENDQSAKKMVTIKI